MSLPQFNDIKTYSNLEIAEAITRTEKELFNLIFKKATRQPFKSHEIKYAKRRIAHLKTLLTLRLASLETTTDNTVSNIMRQQNYLTGNF